MKKKKKLKAYRPANHTKTSERITMSVPMKKKKKLKAYRPANHAKTSERITMSVPMSREQFERWARDLEKKWQEEIKANPMAAAPLLKAYEEFKVFTAIRYPDCRAIFDVGDGKRIDWDFFIEKIMEWKGITREEAEGKTLREWRWEQNRDLQDELHRRKAFEEGIEEGMLRG